MKTLSIHKDNTSLASETVGNGGTQRMYSSLCSQKKTSLTGKLCLFISFL